MEHFIKYSNYIKFRRPIYSKLSHVQNPSVCIYYSLLKVWPTTIECLSHWVWATAGAVNNAPIVDRQNLGYGLRVKWKEKYLSIRNVTISIILRNEFPGNNNLFTLHLQVPKQSMVNFCSKRNTKLKKKQKLRYPTLTSLWTLSYSEPRHS